MDIKEPVAKYHPKMSPSEYLSWERSEEEKHEYVDGEIINMSGASLRHNRIHANLIGELHARLKGKECTVFPSELRLYVKSKESFFYPDATIVCGEPELVDDKMDMIANPTAVFEILSPSTTDYDMGRKFFFYMQIPSLKEYIMIDSLKKGIRIWRKSPGNNWKFEELQNETGILQITTINNTISFAELYAGVIF